MAALNFNQTPELQYQKRIVMGVTKFKGEIQGSNIDMCKVLVAAPLPDNGDAKGFGVSKISFGDSANFTRFAGLTFPCELELAFVNETNSSGQEKIILKDVRVIAASKG